MIQISPIRIWIPNLEKWRTHEGSKSSQEGFESSSFGFESQLVENSKLLQEFRILEFQIRIPFAIGAFNAWS